MLCEKPYWVGAIPAPCASCFPCRINRRRLWAHRINLEREKHGDSCFVTLTYDEEHCPIDGALKPKHAQDWLKRLRKAVSPLKIRYFLAGEYGPDRFRPHYHAAVFGLDPLTAGALDGQGGVVNRTWSLGYSFVGELNEHSSMYIAGYVTKKMSAGRDSRLGDKQPEFSRMSLRPGIGAPAVPDIARVLDTDVGLRVIDSRGDVPHALEYGKTALPLGRYLRGILREAAGFGSRDTPLGAQKAYALQMRDLQKTLIQTAKNPSLPIGKLFLDKYKQKRDNLIYRTKAYAQKETL